MKDLSTKDRPVKEILIDKAIGSRELIHHFPLAEYGRLTKLDSADIAFPGNGPDNIPLSIGIEIKSLRDFLDSTQNGRLHGRQSRIMLQTYDVVYLLIYGVIKCDPETGNLMVLIGRTWKPFQRSKYSEPLRYSTYVSCLSSTESIGVRCHELPFSYLPSNISATRDQIAHWIFARYQWWSKRWEEHRSIRALDGSRKITKNTTDLETMGLTDNQLLIANIAKECPGIQFERAMAIAREFDSPREFINAGQKPVDAKELLRRSRAFRAKVSEIVTVSGKGRRVRIGDKTAERIDNALDGRI